MGPYARVDYNLTLCPLQKSTLAHLRWATPYARVDFIPHSGILDLDNWTVRPCYDIELQYLY